MSDFNLIETESIIYDSLDRMKEVILNQDSIKVKYQYKGDTIIVIRKNNEIYSMWLNGNIIESKDIWNRDVFQYNSNNDLVKITRFNLKEEVQSTNLYTYKNGLLVLQEKKNASGFTQLRFTYKYEYYR